jgi:hypothetical protein
VTGPDGSHTLTGAYALDALDARERAEFEAHLAECPECVREADELRRTAARLALAVAEHPPPRLREQVLDRIAVTRQDPPPVAELPPPAPAPARVPARAASRWAPRLAAAAAGVALLAAVGSGVLAARTQHELVATQGALAQTQARYAALVEVSGAPDVRTASGRMAGSDGTATLLVSRRLGKAVLVFDGIPVAPPGHVYQAWQSEPGGMRPAGLLADRPAAGGTGPGGPLAITLAAATSGIGVTVEPDGGSAHPSGSPVMLIPLP